MNKNFFREMLEEKEADQFKNWSEASKKLKDDDRFTKAPDDEKREWYISFLKTQELEGKYWKKNIRLEDNVEFRFW